MPAVSENSLHEDEYDRLDGPSHAGTVGDTISEVLEDLLAMDLTYENSDDGAVLLRGRTAAQDKKNDLKHLTNRERDWLASELAIVLAKQPASLTIACWVVGRSVPTQRPAPIPAASSAGHPSSQSKSKSKYTQFTSPSNTTIASARRSSTSGRTPGLLRRLLRRLRRRPGVGQQGTWSQTQTGGSLLVVGLPSRRDARPGPEHTNELRAMLANPLQHRGPLLNNLFYAGSAAVGPSWRIGRNGRRKHVWTSAHGVYRTHRPGTLGSPELLRTAITIVPVQAGQWRVTTCQTVPLYAEDVGRQNRQFPTLEEATRYAEEFLADRFRIVHEGVLGFLTDLSVEGSMHASHEAHAAVLELIAKLLGEEYRSPCTPLIGLWDKTLRSFLDEVRKQEPGSVETYFALLPGWSLGKRELKSTVKRLVDNTAPDEEGEDG